MSRAMDSSVIREQVRLPLRMVLEIVLQGLRIRLGRSIVTILGVAMGIAFLMSMLTSQLMRQGVAQETQLRAETDRMLSFLTADSGPLQQATVGLVATGPLDAVETRFVRAIHDAGAAKMNWARGIDPPQSLASVVTTVEKNQIGTDALVVIVLGDGPMPPVEELLPGAGSKVLAVTRMREIPETVGVIVSPLARPAQPDELEAQAAAAKREHFRGIWIIVISLLVTVIGIANSMLMSVTERFREIGTMKCLGALSSFIRRLFLVESALIGSSGAVLGTLLGAMLPLALFGPRYGFGLVFSSMQWGRLGLYGGGSIAVGIVLAIVAALYPARFASKMVPAAALRSNI